MSLAYSKASPINKAELTRENAAKSVPEAAYEFWASCTEAHKYQMTFTIKTLMIITHNLTS